MVVRFRFTIRVKSPDHAFFGPNNFQLKSTHTRALSIFRQKTDRNGILPYLAEGMAENRLLRKVGRFWPRDLGGRDFLNREINSVGSVSRGAP